MALVPVPPEFLIKQLPLFRDFPGLHGAINAALEGSLGTVRADEPTDPRLCYIAFHDFHIIAGDSRLPAAREALAAVPDGHHVAAPAPWSRLVQSARRVRPYDRFAFRAAEEWDRTHLAALRNGLAAGYCLERVDPENVEAFVSLATSLIENFASAADFLERGLGSA
jgi:GNAT acetyltransferase